MGLRIRFFDTFRVEGAGWRTSQFGTLRAAKLMALLALSKRKRLLREDLADALWPEDFYDATRLRLRQEVFRLKKALEAFGHVVSTTADEIALDDSEISTDLDDLKAALSLPPEHPGRRRALEAALTETDGVFLRGWDDLWVIAERSAAEDLRLRAITALGEALLADSLYDDAVRVVESAVRNNPTNESIRMVAVQAHAAGGSLAAAVNEYQQFRRLLADHGQEPTEEAQTMAASIQTFGFPRSIPASPQYTVNLVLPHPIERIFGRTRELESLNSLLVDAARCRCVTLTGPGGIGKTRLAVEAAHHLLENFDQAGFVSLAELEEPAGFAAFMLERLGLQPPPNGDLLTYLARSLGAGRLLLVLDSAEHLLPSVASSIKTLLTAAPRLSLIVTSRASLGIGGEHLLTVGPLDQSEGQQMLAELWSMQRGRSSPSEQDALARLADRLDGYPLALKLAASRLRFLSPSELEDQLRQSVSTLKASGGDFEDRHRSLDAALRDSYKALNPAEQQALVSAAAFRGGLTLRMADRALGPDGGDLLERLHDKSLLMLDDRSARVRFRMLGPIREFVEEAAGAKATAQAADRFLSTCVTWMNEFALGFDRAITADMLQRLDGEHENLQHASIVAKDGEPVDLARFVVQTWPYKAARGRHSAVLASLDHLWPDLDDLEPELKCELLIARAFLYIGRSREAEGEIFLGQAEVLARELADDRLMAIAGVLRAHYVGRAAMLQRGSLSEAAEVAERSIALAQGLKNEFLTARARSMAGYVAQFRNRHSEAVGYLEPAFASLQSLGEILICGTVGLALSEALRHVDRDADADRIMEAAGAIVIQTGDPVRIAHMYETRGRIALRRRQLEDAEYFFREGLKFHTNIDNRYQMAYQLDQLARVHAEQGLLKPSRDCLVRAANYWKEDGNLSSICASLTGAARIQFEAGDPTSASETLAFARKFETAWKLELVSADLSDRAELEKRCEPADEPSEASVEAAMQIFSRLADLPL